MTNAYKKINSFLLLPQLKEDRDIRSDGAGTWSLHPGSAFQNVAVSLEYQAPGELSNVSSVPTMWAHPLTVEMALHNPKHPIKDQVVEQWRGMLAAIALAAVKGHPLKAKRIQVGALRYHQFDKALDRLIPDPTNALYDIDKTGEQHPWRDLFVFFWKNRPVGMTSPSTLVVPAEDADWSGLRWYDPTTKTLRSPHNALQTEDKEQLWLWLQNLQIALSVPGLQGSKTAANTINRLIDDFKIDLLAQPPEVPLALSGDDQFFGIPINRGILRALNKPIRPASKASSVAVVPQGKTPEKEMVLVDLAIATRWGCQLEDIYVYQEKTLARIDLDKIEEHQFKWKDSIRLVTPNDLFLPDLKFIDHEAEGVPGGLLPATEQPLIFAGEQITPLIPVSSVLLEYFTPENLVQRMKFKPVDGGEPQIEVSLDLPLTGLSGDQPENYRITRTYTLKREHAIAQIPVLELWPNFISANWRAYYALFFDLGAGAQTFRIKFPESLETETFRDDQGGSYSLTRMSGFPSSIECTSETGEVIGLILPKQPPEVFPNAKWKVGVDFGTSFTNIYVGRNGKSAEPLIFDEELLVKVTNSLLDTRFPVLLDYFIPDRFLPIEKPLPLSSVLTTRGSNHHGIGERAILDGRIYNPNVRAFDPAENWIETDLKWKNFDSNRLFLQHLILHISANVTKQGANSLEWLLSYPSAFSRNDHDLYASTWTDLLRSSSNLTGISHQCSEDAAESSFKTESLALAQYFADQERLDMIYSTCIDMGGGTSDISIWQDNLLLHQCSIKFAGRELLSNFLELKPGFIATYFERDPAEWVGLRGGDFHAKLDVLLRWESENWLRDKRKKLIDNKEVDGLLLLMALGICGLYYYVGLLLKVLRSQGTYTRDTATPVYLGGNGSRLLHWLAVTGSFRKNSEISLLLSRMLSKGADIEDTEEETRLSKQPKDEVACGLVLDITKLKGMQRRAQDVLIPGEAFVVNNQPFSWDQPMHIEEDIDTFDIPSLDNLNTFLYEFHRALRNLGVEGIRPLPGYTISLEFSDNAKLWQGTKRSLDKILKKSAIKGEPNRVQMQPPFILGLKALLDYLGQGWAESR